MNKADLVHFGDGIGQTPSVRFYLFLAKEERLVSLDHRFEVSMGHGGLHQVDVVADLKVLEVSHHAALAAKHLCNGHLGQVGDVDVYIDILKDHLDRDRQLR